MFNKIMVPVDLAHVEQLERSLSVAADMSRLYNAPICYVGVTGTGPGPIAKTPDEYEQKLQAFADQQASAGGHKASARAFSSNDLVTDVDDALLKAVKETEADLVVMASHIPSITDYVWPSNGGKVAAHADTTVCVVR